MFTDPSCPWIARLNRGGGRPRNRQTGLGEVSKADLLGNRALQDEYDRSAGVPWPALVKAAVTTTRSTFKIEDPSPGPPVSAL